MSAMFGKHVVPTAKAVLWVRADVYAQVEAERDTAERLLAEAERRIGELEREVARLRCRPVPLPV